MPTGTLEVIVVEGRHLKDRDLVGENDTYVEIYLDKKYKQRITTISNSNNTVWNQCFTFNLQKGDDTIHFDIYDADVIGRDSIGNWKQIPILNDSQIKVQMATARIRKTKQLVEGSQPLARSKQIPREGSRYLQQKIGCE
ncbi:unnamed protein product [Rotaria sordida]|uniref:C2 domain-containing protein n=1 Tax=Rotaria sordida TaxID=392033 RepID=A0A819ERB1_9BILA|nr:unnamed protein product [Rotaria sordida]